MLDHPGALISGLFIGLIGMALFVMGKRAGDLKLLLAGLAMCVYPYFIENVWLMWAITAACLVWVWHAVRNDL